MRTIPAALQAHLNERVTTTTRLLKITTRAGFTYGLCMLDQAIEYDDGEGLVTYVATNGFDPSTLSSDTAYGVANAEAQSLISEDIDGIELEDIQAGELDDARWVMYLVNFRDLSMGHAIIDAGDLGEVRVRHGQAFTAELLSYVSRLKQSIGGVWSRRCRAVFGTPHDSPTGCGVDLAPLWVNGTVSSVGSEANRVFSGSAVIGPSGVVPAPGRVQFLTGANAAREFAVEEVASPEIVLAEPANYPIAPGDTYRIRPDCLKRFQEDCIDTWDNGPNFKGEPEIPVGDATGIQAPGAQLGRGGGFVSPLDTTPDES